MFKNFIKKISVIIGLAEKVKIVSSKKNYRIYIQNQIFLKKIFYCEKDIKYNFFLTFYYFGHLLPTLIIEPDVLHFFCEMVICFQWNSYLGLQLKKPRKTIPSRKIFFSWERSWLWKTKTNAVYMLIEGVQNDGFENSFSDH